MAAGAAVVGSAFVTVSQVLLGGCELGKVRCPHYVTIPVS